MHANGLTVEEDDEGGGADLHILTGRARAGRIVTHHGRLEDAPDLYQQFDRRANGVIKAVLRPN